ncbi:MAG TPA: helix-turn-helix domain-containing protein [Albidovulum sp.]|uniref:winged helix-turn-helix transcriptional regulator n=1 Tax=Albidovulum sp. TaxID=1872424 RepID=UPI002C330E2D|nr:helix-turn-helix domain-containing protein [Albidovulum sp.]
MTDPGENPRPSRRSIHEEGCIAAHALDILGERWTFLVMRELMFGPKRFGLIRAGLPGISASVLTQRLEGLEASGIVRRMLLPKPAEVQVYALTDVGLAARPVIEALCRWGVRMPGHDPTKFISPTSLMFSMMVMVDEDAARGLAVQAGFDLGRESFRGALVAGRWQVEPGPAEGDLVFAGSPNALAPVIYGPQPLAHWSGSETVRFSGDPALGQRFIDLFSLRRG